MSDEKQKDTRRVISVELRKHMLDKMHEKSTELEQLELEVELLEMLLRSTKIEEG